MGRFVVIENTPGYLPDIDTPEVEYETWEEAQGEARRREEYLEEDGYKLIGGERQAGGYYVTYWVRGVRDLGRVVEILDLEEG